MLTRVYFRHLNKSPLTLRRGDWKCKNANSFPGFRTHSFSTLFSLLHHVLSDCVGALLLFLLESPCDGSLRGIDQSGWAPKKMLLLCIMGSVGAQGQDTSAALLCRSLQDAAITTINANSANSDEFCVTMQFYPITANSTF